MARGARAVGRVWVKARGGCQLHLLGSRAWKTGGESSKKKKKKVRVSPPESNPHIGAIFQQRPFCMALMVQESLALQEDGAQVPSV